MKKSYLFKLLVFAVIAAFVTVTSCKDYDDDINRLDTELSGVKADYAAKIDALRSELNSAIDTKVNAVKDDLTALQTKVTTLEAELAKAATKTELQAAIDAAKTEILNKVVTLEAFNTYKSTTDAAILALQNKVTALETNSATKAELAALESALNTEISGVKTLITNLTGKVSTLETNYTNLSTTVATLGTDLGNLTTEVRTHISLVTSLLGIVDGKSTVLNQIQTDLSEQLKKITANSDSIDSVAKDLNTKYLELVEVDEELQRQITKNANDIIAINKYIDETLKPKLQGIENDITNLKGRMTTAEAKIELNISNIFILSRQVSSLTFIPDYTSWDGTPQLLVTLLGEWYKPDAKKESWAGKAKGTAYKGITYAKFHVSPSNATLNDFEVVGLLHKTSEIIMRSLEEPLLKALVDEVTLEGGILTVPILVHSDIYDAENFDEGNSPYSASASTRNGYAPTNVSVALQVKNKDIAVENSENGVEPLVVSTEYINTDLNLLYARVDTEEGAVGSDLYPTALASDIHLADYPADVELWNGYDRVKGTFNANYTINLNDYVQAVADFNGKWRLLEEWGYEGIEEKFVFEKINLTNEGVDQSSRYLSLNGATGEITVVANEVAPGTANSAAVGRTPVVLAKVVVDGKVYAVGYIKILITDEFDNTPITDIPPFVLDPFTLDCNAEYVFTDGNKMRADMDQIFNHERVALGKDLFFDEYDQPITHTISKFVPAIAGNTANASDFLFQYATYQDTQSGQLANYIEGSVKNTAPAGKYTIKTTLSSHGYRPDIILTWEIEVKLPVISLTANTAILTDGKVVVNPTILEQGAKTSAAYEAKLNNAFMHNAGDYVFTPLPEACDDYLTPYFVFTGVGLPTGYSVSIDGTKIMKGTDVAAIIETDLEDTEIFFVRLNYDDANWDGSWNNFVPLSEASKGLVGKTVKVQPRGYINGVAYNWINLYAPFDVEFVKPLNLVLPQDAAVYDQANQGLNVYTFNPYDPTTAIVDWNGAEVNITTAYGRSLINHYEVGTQPVPGTAVITDWVFAGWHPGPGRVTRTGHLGWWYAPVSAPSVTYSSPFVFNDANAKCNIQADGTIGGAINRPLPAGLSIKTGVVEAAGYETVIVGADNISMPTTYTFEWENASTGAIQDEFKVAIPVTVTHKWGKLESSLVISIKPGSGN